ncbi:MAG TPA: 50S ribosomal protein L23 [Candidatus Nanoarchaeia archaeon]|nr:50S ribosomal protein L23 [uncultured archaeon]
MQSLKVIKKPVITEKALSEAEGGEYTFEVDKKATKAEIAKAVKEMYEVDVVRIKTRVIKNRHRRILRTSRRAKLGPVKKATVKVGKEQKIDIFEVKESK